MGVDQSILDKANKWLTATFDEKTKQQIKNLISSNPSELNDCFYKSLEFGTGGMRGIMGPGDNRINPYTLGKNTQGLSQYLKETFNGVPLRVAIAFDCRNNSKELAKVVADVFSANGIQVFLFSDLRPTPELSFAVKHLNCQCGIVLTASHNPPEYNGYKVYWVDGGQLVPPQDKEIITLINSLDYDDINFKANESLISYIDQEVDLPFLKATIKNGTFGLTKSARESLNIVFTPLHGTSVTMIPKALEMAGYTQVHIVKEQEQPDGNFPTVVSPNPEEPEALAMALALAEKTKADIVIGTDPDCDRLGIAIRNFNGEMILLNGNQAMVVMTDFLIQYWKENKRLNGKQFVASTIVSTPMMETITEANGVECKISLTGFKWIAKMIKDHPEQEFIGGGEESFGFMVGDFVRDKDAVTATLLACEIAALAKSQGSSFYEQLIKLYLKHGLYKEHLISVIKKGISGAEEIKQIMINLRDKPLNEIAGSKVIAIMDYQSSIATDVVNNNKTKINIPKSNVLIFYTEDGSKIAARPSGTEPKIKFYISVNKKLNSFEEFDTLSKQMDNRIKEIIKALNQNLK